MPDLAFQVRDAEAGSDTATPTITLHIDVSNRAAEPIHTVVLRCQIQIETPRRRYTAAEQAGLRDLFGEPERWGQTLRPMLWTNVATTIPAFTGSTAIALSVPCTFDFNVSATKYFHALEAGAVPLTLLFSGTVFYQSSDGRLQVAPISWSSEAKFVLPVGVWKDSIDRHYPNTAWLCLRRDVFDRLYEFKVQEGIATFDDAIERMLMAVEQVGI